MGGSRVGERLKREGIYVNLWLIHIVWQKPTHYCKTVILQLKIKGLASLMAQWLRIHLPVQETWV